ncbi:MAG: TIGR04283 family arsenosugar biosynthesis glycosyltransferase [Burkholderiales bacterium]
MRRSTREKLKAGARLSIVIPVLNEAAVIARALANLQALRARRVEVIVVDGGSEDGTSEIARGFVDRIIVAPRGRAAQMNAGADVANGEALLFLHADSSLPEDADRLILDALKSSHWGRFDVRLSGSHPLFRLIEALMNVRSRLSGIATGDQGIFVRRNTFYEYGGYPDIALMEDIALSKRLKQAGRPACLRQRIVTSSRRWEENGVVRTVIKMWFLRLAYALGASPKRLAHIYGR